MNFPINKEIVYWSSTGSFEQSHRRGNQHNLKNEFMACYDLIVQVHCCYLNNPREKVDRNFDNEIQLVDLWSANEMTFEKMKDKISGGSQRQESLFNAFRLIEKCIFHGSMESCCNEISFANT